MRTIKEIDALLAVAGMKMYLWQGSKTGTYFGRVIERETHEVNVVDVAVGDSKRQAYNKAFDCWAQGGKDA